MPKHPHPNPFSLSLLLSTDSFCFVFSVTKLAVLLVKTLAKPLSKRIKHEFSRSGVTKNLLIGIGQTSHQVTSRMTIWSAGYTVRSITPLEKEKALSMGADFVGEFFILLVSGSTVVFEYNRSAEKTRRKEEKMRRVAAEERTALQKKLKALDVRVKALEEAAVAERRQVEADEASWTARMPLLAKKHHPVKYQAPNPHDIVPILDEEEEEEDSSKSKDALATEADNTNTNTNSSTRTVDTRTTEAAQPGHDASSWWSWRPW